MSALRIGVVGAGNMGADHVTTLHRHVSGAEVTLVADIDKERAAFVAGTVPGARAVDDPYAAIADTDVDAVVIASHDSTHADVHAATANGDSQSRCGSPSERAHPSLRRSQRVTVTGCCVRGEGGARPGRCLPHGRRAADPVKVAAMAAPPFMHAETRQAKP